MPYVMPLSTVAVAGAALIAGQNPEMATVAIPLTMTSNFFASIATEKLSNMQISNRLKKVKPDKLNHDVLRVSKFSVGLALKRTKEWYIEEKNITGEIAQRVEDAVDKICTRLKDDNLWKDKDKIETQDIVQYERDVQAKFADALLEELSEIEDILNDEAFYTQFQKYFHLYFVEHLKDKKFRPALIAYECEIQKMILNAVHDIKDQLTDRDYAEIDLVIKESIEKYIKEVSVADVSVKISDEFEKAFQNYFRAKEIITISRIDDDTLHIEGYPRVQNYEQLQELLDGKYQFKYNDDLYYVDELNEQTFDYLAGKIKYNQLFTKRIIEAIKEDLCEQKSFFYQKIAANPRWDTTSSYEKGQRVLYENFMGKIIGGQLSLLFSIGQENNDEKKNADYIKKCRYIVHRTLDLVIFAFLSQLWDDVCKQNITLSDNPLSGFNTMKEGQMELLKTLIHIYKKHETGASLFFIADILTIADQFDENGELYNAIAALEKFGNKPTLLDCYFAEKHLTTFFEYFRFLVKYKVVSVKKIEYFSIKNIEAKYYLHHHENLKFSMNDTPNKEKKEGNICEMTHSLFTNAVLLYKGAIYTENINLFPFVIDYHALLTSEKKARIAFFREIDVDEKSLEYAYLDSGEIPSRELNEPLELKYDEKGEPKPDENNVIYLTDTEMATYNINNVYHTFEKINKQLFI